MYIISTDKSMLDIELIHGFLSERSYWAQNISREIVEHSIQNSLCFGGIAKQLMAAVRAYPALQGLRRWHLVTTDAHALYRQFGFRELESPQKHMEIVVKNPYW